MRFALQYAAGEQARESGVMLPVSFAFGHTWQAYHRKSAEYFYHVLLYENLCLLERHVMQQGGCTRTQRAATHGRRQEVKSRCGATSTRPESEQGSTNAIRTARRKILKNEGWIAATTRQMISESTSKYVLDYEHEQPQEFCFRKNEENTYDPYVVPVHDNEERDDKLLQARKGRTGALDLLLVFDDFLNSKSTSSTAVPAVD